MSAYSESKHMNEYCYLKKKKEKRYFGLLTLHLNKNSKRINQNKYHYKRAMHGMWCCFPNT